MATFISHSPEETSTLGEQWGRAATAGWIIGLKGDLGAGKTQLVKGLARGLGIADAVRSPTFALVHEYAGGRLPLAHLDFYRLETPAAITAAGLEEYLFAPRGVTVIEWIERWLGEDQSSNSKVQNSKSKVQSLLGRYREVEIESLGVTRRRIIYEDFGD